MNTICFIGEAGIDNDHNGVKITRREYQVKCISLLATIILIPLYLAFGETTPATEESAPPSRVHRVNGYRANTGHYS